MTKKYILDTLVIIFKNSYPNYFNPHMNWDSLVHVKERGMSIGKYWEVDVSCDIFNFKYKEKIILSPEYQTKMGEWMRTYFNYKHDSLGIYGRLNKFTII